MEIKLLSENISVFYLTRNHRRFYTWNTTAEITSKLFQPLKEFWKYFKIISETPNVLQNIHELQWACEIISGKFPHTEVRLFQTDVDSSLTSLHYLAKHKHEPWKLCPFSHAVYRVSKTTLLLLAIASTSINQF